MPPAGALDRSTNPGFELMRRLTHTPTGSSRRRSGSSSWPCRPSRPTCAHAGAVKRVLQSVLISPKFPAAGRPRGRGPVPGRRLGARLAPVLLPLDLDARPGALRQPVVHRIADDRDARRVVAVLLREDRPIRNLIDAGVAVPARHPESGGSAAPSRTAWRVPRRSSGPAGTACHRPAVAAIRRKDGRVIPVDRSVRLTSNHLPQEG